MVTQQNKDDFQVIHRVLAGDINAFEKLLEKYQDHVFMIVSKHLPQDMVEEIAHETFIKAYTAMVSFKFESSFSHWLSTIAVRTCHDFWRKRYRNQEIPVSVFTDKHHDWLEQVTSEQSGRSFKQDQNRKEAQEVLELVLSQLSASDRMLVSLMFVEGYSGKETAELLDWSLANVKVRTFRIRHKLRKLLAELQTYKPEESQ